MEYTLATIDQKSWDRVVFAEWLADEGFIESAEQACNRCGAGMAFGESKHFRRDRVAVRCTNQRCRAYHSIRDGSFFQPSPLSIKQQMQLLALFGGEATVSSAARVLRIGRKAVTNFFDNCRGIWSDFLSWDPVEFPECGEFEIDECLIHRVRDSEHNAFIDVWIAGILARFTGKVLLYRVPDRTTQSLVPPILAAVPEGSIIYSDELKSSNELDKHTYEHYTVNHSRGEYQRTEQIGGGEVVNVHINTLEGVWTLVRSRLRFRARRDLARLDLILDEIVYRHSNANFMFPFKWFLE